MTSHYRGEDLNSFWLHKSLNAVWHPCTQMQHHPQLPLVPIKRAQGAWLYDFNDHAILDAISSWWVNIFGHGHPHIVSAIQKQASTLSHVMLAGFTHSPVILLSERLAKLAPEGLGHCFYASDGASAIEIALKMSVQAWQQQGYKEKQKFAYLKHSYHGETLGALAVTDISFFRQHHHPILSSHIILPSPDPRLCDPDAKTLDPEGRSAEESAKIALKQAEAILEKEHTTLTAIVVEPLVQGVAGMLMYHSDYLKGLRALCDHYRIHLIADEIMTGFGRTGTLFACEQAAIRPDFICLSKALTGGTLPLSVVMCTEAIYQTFFHPDLQKAFVHSHSYTGNPIACAAACAVLELFEQENILEKNKILSQKIARYTQPIATHPAVFHVRQRGMIMAFDVHTTDALWNQKAFEIALKHHALIRPIGNSLYIMPPYCLNDEELETLFNAIDQILTHTT